MAPPLIPVIILGTGTYLTWYGIHYWRSASKYPTDPIKSVLQGKGVPAPTGQTSAASLFTTAAPGTATASTAASAAATGITTAPTADAAKNQAVGQLVAAAYGWSEAQNATEWNDLVKLWNQESGWSNSATNPTSGAYGIAQALGHGAGTATQGSVTNQYGGYGISNAMAQAANSGDAASQITWGCQYIKETYGDPVAAWQHEESAGWY
jgi:hypothetical protein